MVCEVDMITQFLPQIFSYHVKFKVHLVSKPLVYEVWQHYVDSVFFCILFKKIYNKTIIEFRFHMISWIMKPFFIPCIDNSWYRA